jgi:hypothetical protein
VAAAPGVLAYPLGYSYPKYLPYAMVFIAFFAYVTRPSRGRLVLTAAAVACAFLLRHDHGVILGGAVGVALAAETVPVRLRLRNVALFVVCAVALTVPYLAWVQAHDGIVEYVRDGIAFSQREAEKADWSFPRLAIDPDAPVIEWKPLGPPARDPAVNVRWVEGLSPERQIERERAHGLTRVQAEGERTWRYELRAAADADLRQLVEDPLVEDTQGIDRQTFALLDQPERSWLNELSIPVPGSALRSTTNGAGILFYLVWAWPLLVAVALLARWHDLPPAFRSIVVLAAAVQIGMNLTMLRDPLTTRIRDVLAPTGVLIACALAAPLLRVVRASWTPAYRVVAVGLAVMTLAAAGAVGSAGQTLADTGVTRSFGLGTFDRARAIRREFAPPHERTGRQDQPLVRYLAACTPVGARILTIAFAPQLFFYTGRAFAAGQVALIAGYSATTRADAQMLERMQRQDVPFVVLDRDFEREMALSWPRLAAHVTANYSEVFSVSENRQTVAVLADRRRVPLGTFGARNSPCFVS